MVKKILNEKHACETVVVIDKEKENISSVQIKENRER